MARRGSSQSRPSPASVRLEFSSFKTKIEENFWLNRLQIKSISLPSGSGSITSLTLLDPMTVLVGTDSGRIFQVDTLTFDIAILSTCHTSNISDMAFPRYGAGKE